MIAKELATRLLSSVRQRTVITQNKNIVWSAQQRFASTTNVFFPQQQPLHNTVLDKALLQSTIIKTDTNVSAVNVSEYVSRLLPFHPPAPPQPVIITPSSIPPATKPVQEGMQLISTLRRRRLKMNKHKYKKLRKRTRALRRKLGK